MSEHLRCYDEIIVYYNDLVYKGRLQPMRGGGISDEKRPEIMDSFPIIEYHDIAVITPFRVQANEIRKQMQIAFGSNSIPVAVGTVHTSQGAERKIIISLQHTVRTKAGSLSTGV